jgi:hypothetical protein
MIETLGTCPYCGQVQTIKTSTTLPEGWDANTPAGYLCDCHGAEQARAARRADEEFDKLLMGGSGFEPLGVDLGNVVATLRDLVMCGDVRRASISLASEVIKVSKTKEGVHITREQKHVWAL